MPRCESCVLLETTGASVTPTTLARVCPGLSRGSSRAVVAGRLEPDGLGEFTFRRILGLRALPLFIIPGHLVTSDIKVSRVDCLAE